MFSEKIERSDKSTNYSISDLIILLIYAYSLIGEECYYGIEEEHRVKVFLVLCNVLKLVFDIKNFIFFPSQKKLLINELESEAFQNDQRFKIDYEFIEKSKK